jgi:hypothetical protein
VSRIPRHVARRLDALSRAAHRFHRFAHHPLCEEYAGEVVRFGRRGRVCRGCSYALGGGLGGAVIGLATAVPILPGIALVALASGCIVVTMSVPFARRGSKVLTRLVPAAAMGLAIGAGLRAANVAGVALALLATSVISALGVLYRRRGPDRTPCATCPERAGAAPCRGYAAIVHRERVFQKIASRMLARAGF